jgi:uncharacterized MAPEG superfamily protein
MVVMPSELKMLTFSVVVLLVLILIQAVAGVVAQGFTRMAGNRDSLPPPSVFQARMRRVVDNHREGLILFAPLVFILTFNGITAFPMTVLGAQMFFYSRVVHAVTYVFGVPYIRTLAWLVGIAGTFMLLVPLLGIYFGQGASAL